MVVVVQMVKMVSTVVVVGGRRTIAVLGAPSGLPGPTACRRHDCVEGGEARSGGAMPVGHARAIEPRPVSANVRDVIRTRSYSGMHAH